MKIIARKYSDTTALEAMAALVREFPAGNLHVVDLPYRFSSWSFDYPENIRLWTDENGQLLAWAVLQVPFWTIDYAYHPKADPELHQQILKWADEQAQKIVRTPSGHPTWYVTVLESQPDRIRDLEKAGFASQANIGENSWTQVLMEHSTPLALKEFSLPTGFTIRPFNGASEVHAYVELHRSVFDSKNMTIEWRRRTLERPEYIPDLDLVIAAPDGNLAAFCIGWLAKSTNGESRGQIEPMGVHADFRNLGLGKAILLDVLRRMYSRGVKQVYVQTDNYRDAAFRLYESAGFRLIKNIIMYRKDY